MIAATLLGAEPIPLLDVPLQVALCWRMALQLACVHGRPGLDYRSREMVAAIATTLSARMVAQQVLKLAPFVGWLGSAALSGTGAWLLGQGLLRYYSGAHLSGVHGSRVFTWPRLRRGEGASDA